MEIMDWSIVREESGKIEKVGMATVIICIVWGIVAELCVLNGNAWIFIDDINSFSLTLLQVQASVGTLTIALVALISGNISDEYMGVSISNYYLDIRPRFLSQKVIIIWSIILVFLNVGFHIFGLYNLVMGVFFSTGILIIISVVELYEIFRGKTDLVDEIKSYLLFVANNSSYIFAKKNSIFRKFSKDWAENSSNQAQVEYEEWLEIFKIFVSDLLTYNSDESVELIESACVMKSRCLLNSNSVSDNEKGILFIAEIYEFLSSLIRKGQFDISNVTIKFALFGQVSLDLKEMITNISIERLKKCLDWANLSDDVATTAVFFVNDTDEVIEEFEDIVMFSALLGQCLAKQRKKNNELAVVNDTYWRKLISNLHFYAYGVPSNMEEVYLLHKVDMYFALYAGLIFNGFGFLVKENFYYSVLQKVHSRNIYMELLGLTTHCYLYYLSYKESEECIEKEVSSYALDIIKDEKVINYFCHFIEGIFSTNSEIFDVDIEKVIYENLRRYERFPKYSDSKTMIMENVVREFYIFVVAYAKHLFFNRDIFEMSIRGQAIIYYEYLCGYMEKGTKENFLILHSLISDEKIDEASREKEIDLIFHKLEAYISKCYKEQRVKEAKQIQKDYLKNTDSEEVKKRIRERIHSYFGEELASIIKEDVSKECGIKIRLLKMEVFTKDLNEHILNHFFSSMLATVISLIKEELLKKKCVKQIKRNEFNDIEYMSFLKKENIKMLLGADYVVKNKNRNNDKEFKKLTADFLCVYTRYMQDGLALSEGSISLSIQDIVVAIRPVSLIGSKAIWSEEKNKYKYEMSGGVTALFEEEELKEYLENERKVVDITLKANIGINNEQRGFLITHD